jgi:putative glutamine amidotransferase
MKLPLIAMTMDQSPATDIRPFSKGADLYFINAAYVRYVEKAQCLPMVLPTMLQHDRVPGLIYAIDGLLLTGGDDVFAEAYGEKTIPGDWRIDPPRTFFEKELILEALRQNKPVFGICRGHQMLNVALGGSLYQDVPSQFPGAIQHRSLEKPLWHYHDVEIVRSSKLASILHAETLPVTTSHHQAVKEIAPGLMVAARSKDGLVEAIEASDHDFVLGVQWHPETMDDDSSSTLLLDAFLQQCRKKA